MNQNIVITGAGTGIGKSIAEKLALCDYSLLLLGRNQANLDATLKGLKNSDRHKALSCDIRDAGDIRSALNKSGIDELFAVVANAGTGGENHYHEEDRWQTLIDTNLTGTYLTIQECLPLIKNSSAAFKKIVIMSSILARLGVPGYSGYCASKAGLLGLTRSLAAELAPENILVNALCPGWVDTEMAHLGLEGIAQATQVSKEEAFQVAMSHVPLGKMSTTQEVASLVEFLISERQNSITGQTLDINNGALMP